jgi:saccharopine dehydrogenase-like NADP-dependent oxidoreductase
MAHKKIAVLGLGHIGSLVLDELKKYDKQTTGLIDPNNTIEVHGYDLTGGHDFSDDLVIRECLDGMDAVIATTPYMFNKQIAAIAAENNMAYFDVTEDVDTATLVQTLANEQPMIPQCGLAPGMVSILANEMAKTFETVEEIKIRVGALPQTPCNHMRYNFTWSTIGLINEYSNMCTELRNGEIITVPPLQNLERLVVNGVDLEAATTSGGIGTLPHTWQDRAWNVNYKTLRFPGHYQYMQFLHDDLKMHENKDLFAKIFNESVPRVQQDMIIAAIFVTGYKEGKLVQEAYDRLIMPVNAYTAIQLATACGLLTIVDIWLAGKIPNKGFTKQEEIDFDEIMKSKFAKIYVATAGQ